MPYVRGREISRDVNSILQELDVLSKYGVKEITLLGQNVNSYFCENSDFGEIGFPALLKIISRHLEKMNSPIKWIRFESSHPKDFSDELIEVIASEKRVWIRFTALFGSPPMLYSSVSIGTCQVRRTAPEKAACRSRPFFLGLVYYRSH